MDNSNNNLKLIERLHKLGVLKGPNECSSGNKKFNLQKLT